MFAVEAHLSKDIPDIVHHQLEAAEVDIQIAARADRFFEMRLHARCSLRVELAEPIGRADAFAVRDADEGYLDVMVLDSGSTNAYTDVAIAEGKSRVVSVSSAARTILLLKDGKEVERHPIQLSRHELNVVRL